ncbi:MAG: trigger factor [Candidatus Omnitrophica bacterium]|nr:trigger factor [Candidatus Omnitrophota bacterium]MDD5236497.1 trigger factor [Candidatus Omnitrophota bacterium]MDD5610617.1 trigger factor [Candidatus Omnitrophota bacterium]
MKTSVKKIDANKRELSIEVSGEIVTKKFDEVYAKLADEVKVDGFRPGKAPRNVLEKYHASLANERVLNELIPIVCDDALKNEKLDAVELSQIKDVELKPDFLSFKATLEIKPPIPLKDYKGIKLDYEKITVTDEDINKAKEGIKEARKVKEIDDVLAKSLGYVNVQELETYLKNNLYVQKENHQHNQLETQIIEKLLKDVEFTAPKSMVDRQLKDMLQQTKIDLSMRGVPKEQIEAEEENITKRLTPEAEKQVKIYLILEEIAKKENISIDNTMPRKVMELLFNQANWSQKS